jgi:hypothetical protein
MLYQARTFTILKKQFLKSYLLKLQSLINPKKKKDKVSFNTKEIISVWQTILPLFFTVNVIFLQKIYI